MFFILPGLAQCMDDGVVLLVSFFFEGRMRLCRVFARMDCLCGVVVLLPQVCSACQVKPFAVMVSL